MSVDILVRQFAIGDLDSVIQMLRDVSVFDVCRADAVKNASVINRMGVSYACVLEYEGAVKGFGSIFFMSKVRGGRSATIEDVVVAQELRGLGFGRLIVSHLIEQCANESCYKICLESSRRASDFYESLGFEFGGLLGKFFVR